MFQKIRKNKFLKKALVFSSVFIILIICCVFPCFAQAPLIDNVKNNYYVQLYETYFNGQPDTICDIVFYVIATEGIDSPDYDKHLLFTESFLITYGFNYYDNPSDVYASISQNQSSYLCYDNWDSEPKTVYDVLYYSNINDVSSFTSVWNNTFGFAKNLYEQILSLQNGISQLNSQITQKDREINNLNGQIYDFTVSLDELQSEYEELETRFGILQGINADLHTQIDNLEMQLPIEYSNGYSQAVSDFNMFENGLFSIFQAPFVFVQNIVGFEIFGISLIDVLVFLLIVGLSFVLIKFIGGLVL